MNNVERYIDQIIERRSMSADVPPKIPHTITPKIPPEIPPEMPSESGSESALNVIRAVLRRWYIALLVFLVMCGVGVPAIWLFIKPVYSVTGAIRVDPILPNLLTGEMEDFGGRTGYESYLNTQAELVRSSRVIERVADDLKDNDLAFFKNYAEYAPGLLKKLEKRLRAVQKKPEPASILKEALLDGVITIEPGRRSHLIHITMKSKDPGEARQIVDAFIRHYMAVEVSSSTKEEGDKLSLLESERNVLTKNLETQRDAIRRLAQEYGTTTLTSRQDMMLARVTTLLGELTKLEARRINLEAQVQLLEQAKEQTIEPEELLTMRTDYINANPSVQELTKNIVELERDLIIAQQQMTPDNPSLKRKQELLDAFQARLKKKREEVGKEFDSMVSQQQTKASKDKLLAAQAELEQTKAYEQKLREVLAKEDEQTIELGRKQLQMQDLQYQLDLDKEMYDAITRRIQEMKMELKRPAKVSGVINADIYDIRDKRVKYSAALIFFALACGCGLAFLRDKADRSLRTPDDVVKRIGIRVIGTTTSSRAIKPALLPSQIVGDYQTIRANLGLMDGEGIPKKLVITSPGVKEGKTTFAINLATSIAKSGKKVLLVDGDLRKPDIASLLNLPPGSRGLQDVLFGAEFDRAICSIPSSGLDVLPADSHNSADAYELLASPLMAQYINAISQRYDQIIIDAPPVLAFPDALVWAKIADAVLLTSFAGQTTAPDLKEAKERLTEINARVLGTVLSNVRADQGYFRYGYSHYAQSASEVKNNKRTLEKLLLPMQSQQTDSPNAGSQEDTGNSGS